MVLTSELKAAKKFGPGYFIREQMEMREWTQVDLAEVLGITVKHLNKILQENQPLTLDMARVLGEVFNTTAQYWINIDTGYRLWLTQEKTEIEIEADIKGLIYERMPIKDMLSKKWLKPFKLAVELEKQILAFWNWEKLDFSILDKHYLPCLMRKSEAYNQFNASYAITWYRKAIIEAEKFPHLPYNRKNLEKLYNSMHTYTITEKGINQFIKELADIGVIFFVLPHLQKTYLDGAAFYSGKNPVIIYTGRYKRIDNYWFTIAHEIAHVLNHLNEKTPFVLDNLKDGDINNMESEANKIASEKLKHTEILKYLQPYLGYLTTSKVEECAAEHNIHPSIIIGKLAYEKKISYSNQSLYNENVLQYIQKQYQISI
ncbi:MAG TPA: ImmA/IrrE family metallo-endopeptidase [Bacteroidales bacterium]|nr:ImmA/IrrE family metallo-endopeptidase [Bacteroidales bacterium]HPS16783.1 ImmA/IrrE family metallo-endopeptidase [Bacteroidales bacterium]